MTTQQTLQTEEYKQTELGELPKEWSIEKIQGLVEFERGAEPGSENYNDKGKGIRFLRVSDISGNRKEFIFTTSNNIKKCSPENVLITFDGSPGIVKRGFTGAFSSGIRKVKLLTDSIDLDYVFYVLQTSFVQEMILKHSTGVTIKHASKSIPHIKIPFPPLPEQQRIAYVLSTVQNAQEKTENYINSLKELKKSAMKHLFTYGAVSFEDIDKVELKETEIGMMPKSWGVGKFEDIVIPQEKIEISSDSFVSFEHIQSGTGKLLGQASAKKFKTKTPFKKGTLLYGRIRPYLNKVWLAEFNGYCTNDIIRLNAKNSDINFVKYILLSDSFVNYATSKSQGTKMPRVKWEAMKVYPLSIPPLPIQQNIASILSAIDEKIQTEEQKKEALKETFNSLLRDLMTAKIRVNNLKISNNTNTKR